MPPPDGTLDLSSLGAVPRFKPSTPQNDGWASGFNLPGMNTYVYALAVGPDGSLYAGGDFTTAGGVAAHHIARWDGTAWQPLGSGMDGGVYALAVGPDGSLYAGGDFTTAGGVAANRIARWDGRVATPWQWDGPTARPRPGLWAGRLALRRGLG